MRSRVVPGTSSTIATRSPSIRLKKVDLPTFGRPTIATNGFINAPPPISKEFKKKDAPQGRPCIVIINDCYYSIKYVNWELRAISIAWSVNYPQARACGARGYSCGACFADCACKTRTT